MSSARRLAALRVREAGLRFLRDRVVRASAAVAHITCTRLSHARGVPVRGSTPTYLASQSPCRRSPAAASPSSIASMTMTTSWSSCPMVLSLLTRRSVRRRASRSSSSRHAFSDSGPYRGPCCCSWRRGPAAHDPASRILAVIAVPFVLDQAGVTRWFAYAGGVLAALVVLWVVAALLHVRLMRGWEQPR